MPEGESIMATAITPTRTNRAGRTSTARPNRAGRINVGDGERWASLVGGGLLAAYGLSRRTLGGLTLALAGGSLVYRGATGRCQLYGALGISTAEPRGARTSIPAGRGVKIEKSITILRSPQELYAFWRKFENLPRIMHHLESVRPGEGNRSHWVAKGPMGRRVEWDAEIITEKENVLIGWRSLEGSDVDTAGSVHFTPAPGDRGTEVKVSLKYDVPAGKAGTALAWLFGKAPGQQVQEDLRHFKQVMEAGTIPTLEGQPMGRCR
jgi:uncharacterized membrane protein